jgi:hypothetical protein
LRAQTLHPPPWDRNVIAGRGVGLDDACHGAMRT